MPKLGMKPIREEQVVEATKRCIVEKGFSNLSVKDISSEAGVSTGVMYHYFQNKEDILLKVIKEAFRRSYKQVLDNVEPTKPPVDKLMKYIETLIEVPKDNPDFFVILLNYLGQANSHAEINAIVKRFFTNVVAYVRATLDTVVEDTKMDPRKTGNLPEMIVALGLGLGVMWTIDSGFFDPDAMGKSSKELIRGYIA